MTEPSTIGGITCPSCGGTAFRVLDTRPVVTYGLTRRRKVCINCRHRITTYEGLKGDPNIQRSLSARIKELEQALQQITKIAKSGGIQCQQD